MASTTALSFFSSFPTAATIHKQNPPFLSKPNFSFFTTTSSPLSSHKLTFSPSHISGSSTSSFITRYSDSEAPVIDVESNSETTQIVETTEEETPKPEGVFAVVMIGSRQYIIFPGRFLTTQRLKGANVGDKIILNKVLLVGTKTSTYIGYPVVPDAVVHAVVEDQGLNDKVIVFKYKKKKNYQRNIGHRQPNTRIRITAITGYENSKAVTLESRKLEAETLELLLEPLKSLLEPLKSQKLEAEILQSLFKTLKSQNSETLESLLETLESQKPETLESLLETLESQNSETLEPLLETLAKLK